MAVSDLEARVARLEQLVGASPTLRAEELTAAANATVLSLGDWVRSQARDGKTLVFAGFGRGKANGVSSRTWDGAHFPHDLKAIADLCGALASEQRLGILRELAGAATAGAATAGGSPGRGRRTTAELTAALKLD